VQRERAGLGEGLVVVELQRLPRLAGVGIARRVTRRVERLDRDRVTHDVVGMRISAVLVVRRHDVRAELAHQTHQRRRRDLHRQGREAALGQRRQRVALRQAGVDEAEPRLTYAEDRARGVHLLPPDLGEVREHAGVALQPGVEDRPALPTRARGDQHVDALGHVARHRRGALARLVVGWACTASSRNRSLA
jgi:hypothetical protein